MAAVVERPRAGSDSLRQQSHLTDDVLLFARDYFVASGAKVRVEGADMLSVTTADGTVRRLTSSLARARADAGAELLVPGGEALTEIVAAIEARSGVTALRLSAAFDAEETARRWARTRPGIGDPQGAKARVEAARDAWSVEFTYEMTCRWRDGSRREWVTISLDAETLATEQVLTDDLVARAVTMTLPPEVRARYDHVSQAAEGALARRLAATAGWLRVRGASDFAERLEELRATAGRLAREAPDQAQASADTFDREARRLADVFAVAVEARLARVCFIVSPVADVQFAGPRGGATTLRVDLGRGTARTLAPDRATSLMAVGAASREMTDDAIPPFAAAELSYVPELFWREAVLWLLEDMGHTVERWEDADAGLLVRARRDGRTETVAAVRMDQGQLLSATEIGRVVEQGELHGAEVTLLTPNRLDADAAAEIARIGGRVIGPEQLEEALARRVGAFERRREESLARAETLAGLAGEVRAEALERLERLELALAQAANGRRATGAQVARATATLREARTQAGQAFAAWETLLADWHGQFAERTARDGSLQIVGEETTFAELRGRAEHLASVLTGSFTRVGETPAAGEFGYTAWRRAVIEELTALCEAARWRMQATDPARWRDFGAVVDAQALERAETAIAGAGHARARAEKAYAQLAGRVRVEPR